MVLQIFVFVRWRLSYLKSCWCDLFLFWITMPISGIHFQQDESNLHTVLSSWPITRFQPVSVLKYVYSEWCNSYITYIRNNVIRTLTYIRNGVIRTLTYIRIDVIRTLVFQQSFYFQWFVFFPQIYHHGVLYNLLRFGSGLFFVWE